MQLVDLIHMFHIVLRLKQVVSRRCEVGLQVDCFLKMDNGLVELSLANPCKPQAVMQFRIIGFHPQRFRKMRNGLINFSLHQKDVAQMIVCGCIFGLDLNRFLEMFNCRWYRRINKRI